MGSKRATDQVQDDRQTLGKYPIRVRVTVTVTVTVTVRVRNRNRVRARVQLPMEQPYNIRIIIN